MESKKKLDKKGYVLIYQPDHLYSKFKKGWIQEHRVVVENFIKRGLRKGECVHHLDGNKGNNKIENLMVFKGHREHSKFHNRIRQFGFTGSILKQIKERWKKIK